MTPSSLTFFLCAGEPSGDHLGADLMVSLKETYGPETRFYGVGGPEMKAQGLISEIPMEELGLIGIVELIPHLFRIQKRIHQLTEIIITLKPDAFIGIDCGGLNMRIMKRLKKKQCQVPCFQYSAPQVWAWREYRARHLAQYADHLLCLLPFEPPYFLKYGLSTSFVGHPVATLKDKFPPDPTFRQRFSLSKAPLLAILPGSRKSEVERLTHTFKETILLLKKQIPDLQIVFPTVPQVEEKIRAFAEEVGIPTHVIVDREEKIRAFYECDAALAASGTVTMELAACGTPCVVGYKVAPLSYFIGRCLIKLQYVSIINILNEQEIFPELLQNKCTPKNLAAALIPLFKAPQKTYDGMKKAVSLLSPPTPGIPASQEATRAIQKKLAEI